MILTLNRLIDLSIEMGANINLALSIIGRPMDHDHFDEFQDEAQIDRRSTLAMIGWGAATIAAGLFLPAAPIHAAGPQSAGQVDYLKGGATAVNDGALRELAERAPVFLREVVKTQAKTRMGLRLGSRTRLKLGENAQVRIDKYVIDAGGEIDLVEGAIQFERTGPPAKDELKFRSSYGLIAVRGTRFFAGPSRGVFGVLVGSGRVAVTSGGQTVLVGPQQGTDIAAPGAPPTPVMTWDYSRIREALQSVR